MTKKSDTYEGLIDGSEVLSRIYPEQLWKYVRGCNQHTTDVLCDGWEKNIRKNIKKLLRKHGDVSTHLLGLARDKAVIGVGGGPSLKKNSDILKNVTLFNATYKVKDQPFIIVVSNHQFKPFLKMGIIPHFVMITDGGDAIYDQLNTDIPAIGQTTILIAPLQASHKVLKEWDRLGRRIFFYGHASDLCKKIYEDVEKKDFDKILLFTGGNVMNSIWTFSARILSSKIFMCVGNDLSFPYSNDLAIRRNGYYADGDYEVNIKNDRDEARDNFAWMGFEFPKTNIIQLDSRTKYANLKLFGTSRTLFTYKLWPELHLTRWSDEYGFHYYNCSEAGILGVIPKSYEKDRLVDKDNWELLDTLNPRWHTRTLRDAVAEYLKARQLCHQEDRAVISAGVRNAERLPGRITTANGIGLN